MGYINEEEINKIRNSADIVEIISNYIPLTKKGRNYFGVCPFHDDHSPSMSVSLEKQIFRCFTCGESGNVFTFVQKYENVSFVEAINIVASKLGITLTNLSGIVKKDNKNQKFYDVMDITSKYYENNLKTKSGELAKNYLLERGLSEKVINDFHIGVSFDTKDTLKKLLLSKGYSESLLLDLGLITGEVNSSYDQLKGRIIFPLHNSSGNIIGFTGRIYRGEESAKYVNTKETIIFKKGENLYNYYLAKENAKKEKNVILVEGQMDAIRLYSEGFTNVVATGGTSLTKEQIELLKKLKTKIILCLDNDAPGETATYKMGEELVSDGLEVAVIRLSGAKDPDEYIKKNGRESFKECLKNLIKFLDFKILYLKNNKDLNNSVDLSKYINNVLNELKKEKDEILRNIILQKLSKDYDIDIEVLKNKLGTVTTPIIKKEVVKKIPKRKSKCELACEKILYFMMNNPIYIRIYEKQLGFMPIEIYRVIANEIIYYYDMNKEINMADFITFASNKENISAMVLEVISQDENTIINEEEMDLYIKIVKDNIKMSEIAKLKEKMKNEMDINKKVEIANKIANLKKGSV